MRAGFIVGVTVAFVVWSVSPFNTLSMLVAVGAVVIFTIAFGLAEKLVEPLFARLRRHDDEHAG